MPRSPHASSSSISITVPEPNDLSSPTYPLSSSLPTSSNAKRPSLNTTMNWLSRTPNTTNIPYAPSKPVKISEPKLVRGIDNLTHPRNGALGTGATIVRTPDEALRDTGVRLGSNQTTPKASSKPKKEKKASISKTIGLAPGGGFPFSSPPLPPLPIAESDEERILTQSSSDYDPRGSPSPKRPLFNLARSMPSLPPVPVPRSPSLRPSLKIRSTLSASDEAVVPPLPSVPPSPCPPFKAILMSDLPKLPVDPEKVLITIETCTQTYKTTLETVKSRPSNLSRYLDSLLARHRSESSASSVYSTDNTNVNNRDDVDSLQTGGNAYPSRGFNHQPFSNIHVFLDRPSTPYAHILAYLRSTPDTLECIPRGVQYQQPSPSARLEALIELRDEAAYLRLENLHKMCVDEIRKGHSQREREALAPTKMHTRGNSLSGSIHSVHSALASTSSMGGNTTMQPLQERVETQADPRASVTSLVDVSPPRGYGRRDNNLSDQSSAPSTRGPPTPHSWDHRLMGHVRNQSVPVTSRTLKSPPPGWI